MHLAQAGAPMRRARPRTAAALGTALIMLTAFAVAAPAHASDACSPVRIIVPFAGGGATDVGTRVVAERLQGALNRPFVVENRPGASGNIGTLSVVRAKPDGCTLLVHASILATYGMSFKSLGFDPIADLVPIGGIVEAPALFIAGPQSPFNGMKDLFAAAKSKPEGLSYATPGVGGQHHLAVEDLAQRIGGKFVHVAYRGQAPALTDLMAGRLDFAIFATGGGALMPLAKEGKIKTLGVLRDERTPQAPDVPTVREQGTQVFDASGLFMLFAPAGTPKAVVDEIGDALAKITRDPALKPRFAQLGYDPLTLSPAQGAALMKETAAQWAPSIKRLNIRLD